MAAHDADSAVVREAVAELYAGDPAGFVRRRGDLAARARASGDGTAAKEIASLRKPTRAAWVVNLLVRTDPGAASRLAELGDDLRAAGRSLDGRKLRELSQARRALITALTRQALAGAGQRDAPVALQEAVTATLSAAVADPQVAAELAAGTLVRPVERAGSGFGPAGDIGDAGPAADAGDAAGAGAPPGIAPPARKRAGPDRAGRERAERERAEQERAERARAERKRRLEVIAAAQRAVGQAGRAVDAAQSAERSRAEAVHRLEQQLEDAQDRLAEAKRAARAAAAALRDARRALDRLAPRGPGGPGGPV